MMPLSRFLRFERHGEKASRPIKWRNLRGSRALGDLEGTLHLLDIRCTKCDRHGRERIARLIDRFGRDARLPDIRHQLAGDCPRRNAAVYERCDVYFPNLTP